MRSSSRATVSRAWQGFAGSHAGNSLTFKCPTCGANPNNRCVTVKDPVVVKYLKQPHRQRIIVRREFLDSLTAQR